MITIVLGSNSDFGPLKSAMADLKKHFNINTKVIIASAHRSPGKVESLVRDAVENGTKVFVAGAGGAAHLAGAISARTSKPVIGVPIDTKMGGIDSLLSTAQMPAGVPVATVGVNNFTNAIVLAIQILAIYDDDLSTQLVGYKHYLENKVEEQNALVQEELNA